MTVTSTSKKDTAGAPDQDGAAAASRAAQPGLAAFVGTGPGSAELLTVRAAGLLSRADLLFASAEVTDRVRHLLPPTADLRNLAELDADPRLLVKAVKAGQLAVAAYDGDPLLFGTAAAGAAACAKARVRFEIVPGMPAATAVPAYAGIPLTSEAGGDIRILHAADVSRLSAETQPSRSLVILGVEAGPADLAKMLMAAGWPERTPFTITWNGTTTEQLTIRCALGSVTADLKAAGVSLLTETGPAVGVVGEAAGPPQDLSWFETKPLFGWRVLVPRTKEQAGGVGTAARLRRGAGGGADHRGRAAAHPAADGARGQGPGHRAVPVGRVHLGQRGPRGPREAGGVRAGRARVRRGEGRRGRRADRPGAAGLRHQARPGARG